MYKSSKLILPLLLMLFLHGCASVVKIPADNTNDDAAWQQVLNQHVDAKGRIDFAQQRQQPDLISAAAAYYGYFDPELFAQLDADQQLAFYLNAYNALAMYLAVTADVKPAQQVRFFVLRKLPLLGDPVSLYALENSIIRPLGEPRIHFILNCMVKSCPRLPRTAISAQQLEAQLDSATREFLNSDKYVKLDHDAKSVSLSKILKWYKEDFEHGQSLLEYVNAYRQEPIPTDYSIKWLPYDWTLNQR